jgi:hypothetical protein
VNRSFSTSENPISPLSKNQRFPNQARSMSMMTGMSSDWMSGLVRSPNPAASPNRQFRSGGKGGAGAGAGVDAAAAASAGDSAPATPVTPANAHSAAIRSRLLMAPILTFGIAGVGAKV